jgi:hypothetical protein
MVEEKFFRDEKTSLYKTIFFYQEIVFPPKRQMCSTVRKSFSMTEPNSGRRADIPGGSF